MVMCYAITILVPNFIDFLSVVGSVLFSILGFVFPVNNLFYLISDDFVLSSLQCKG
jgi:hypothetical protein